MEDEERLKEAVLQGQVDATNLVVRIGPSAIPWLQEQMKHPDFEVRLITIFCLQRVGGSKVAETDLQALFDDHIQVRSTALRALYGYADSTHLGPLLEAYDKSSDPFTRHHLALVVGRMDKAVDIRELRKRKEREKDPEAQEGLVTALARLGDQEAQMEFVRQLHATRSLDPIGSRRGRDWRLDYFEHCEYIIHGTLHRRRGLKGDRPRPGRARWLLKPLLPLLEDTTPLIHIGMPHLEYLRACDLAVRLVASISGHRFTFEIAPATTYDEAQRDEVRRYLGSLAA